MDSIRQALTQSLQTGFIDHLIRSDKNFVPQYLINDKAAGKKVLTTIDRELKRCDEFWFSVAFVTTSGVATLINTFIELEKKGIKGKILVSQYQNFTQPEALRRLLRFSNIELKIAVGVDYHSKCYLFKNDQVYDLIIGSSNLTASALCSNKEANMKVSATPDSNMILEALNDFSLDFDRAIHVTLEFIDRYEELYKLQWANNRSIEKTVAEYREVKTVPNSMQKEALMNLSKLRAEGKRKALLISATGTGKTFLSAFDVRNFEANRVLFVVHRENIANAAMNAYKQLFGESKSMGLYSGTSKNRDCDFVFSTVQTLSKESHIQQFSIDHFDYIIIDESHRAGASSYLRIFNHFQPKFLLGMTATPERTDGEDIYKFFDHNIAYEIRLHRAMDEDMLAPFHYYGVKDISIDGELLKEGADFSLLTTEERIQQILEKARLYNSDTGVIRGLVFCSKVEESKVLAEGFNRNGFKAVALSGDNSETDRATAIQRLESEGEDKLDYIFTVDIFNEGIDIPKVNQVIMLRPTQSAIVFVQQLGRGLRKAENKEYLTVIDFIGNYNNNYLVPIALYGDTSFNKDSLRKLMASGSNLIPGSSTINFEPIARDQIFKAIDNANMQLKKDLVLDYGLLKFKIGHIPMMMDFIDHGSRDPFLYANYAKSYYNFVQSQEKEAISSLSEKERKYLELFSNEINNSKRVEESILLRELIQHQNVSKDAFKALIQHNFGYTIDALTIESCIWNLNFQFVREKKGGQLISVNELHDTTVLEVQNDQLSLTTEFRTLLINKTFKTFLLDNTEYSIRTFTNEYNLAKYQNGFVLYRKYSRKDVFRILNWKENPVAQNVGGYIISPDKGNCPIFVTYHKHEDISSATKYEDHFVNNVVFEWMSKNQRTLKSPDVQVIVNSDHELRLPLFIQKNNDEGTEFYYMGELSPPTSYEQVTIQKDGKAVPIVKMQFILEPPVEDNLYDYITDENQG